MSSIEILNVIGYRNEILPCTFFRQEQDTKHLAVLFPGFGYSGQMPLLYYPRQLLLASGADVFVVGYNYSEQPDFLAASIEERDVWLREDTIDSYKTAVSRRIYERVTLAGKAIGTRAIGHLLATEELVPSLRCVWLTPILRNETLCAQIRQRPHRALFVVGTADSHYDTVRLAEAQEATAGEALVIEGADHSLEVKGDVVRSVRVLESVVGEIQKFLR